MNAKKEILCKGYRKITADLGNEILAAVFEKEDGHHFLISESTQINNHFFSGRTWSVPYVFDKNEYEFIGNYYVPSELMVDFLEDTKVTVHRVGY